MGSPYSCAIALQHDRQVAVPPGSQTGADHVQVCQGEALAISPTSLPPPPLLSVDHVADIYHIRKSLPEVKRSVKCLEAGEKNLEFLPLDLLLLLLLHMQVEGGKEGRKGFNSGVTWHGRSQSGGHSSIPHHSMTT